MNLVKSKLVSGKGSNKKIIELATVFGGMVEC